MRTVTHIAAILAAGLVLAPVAQQAQAGRGDGDISGSTPAGQHPIVLQYQRADLASPAALGHTYERMSRAAQQVCEHYTGRELVRQRVFQRCVDATLSAAVDAVHDSRLTALHDSRKPASTAAHSPVRSAQR